eukprot:TRINITY_DN37589_c0_g1_i1.p1 TRINITY_DN37589_c0_g1~~TRINITY_DN37589_c0_g1_i1.p1  ORF type:complete len:766 (-),score=115.44 TRINITY_DN37589_c0_g1_i1:14-2311(-)
MVPPSSALNAAGLRARMASAWRVLTSFCADAFYAPDGERSVVGRSISSGRSPGRALLSNVRSQRPQAHGLPPHVIWGITLLTAVIMALANFCSIWVISFIVSWKFSTVQDTIDTSGQLAGVGVLVLICTCLASLCVIPVIFLAPGAAGSGAPENKGWLNGNSIPGLFTFRNLIFRGNATILANASGFPVGREGPTVTMGSNVAFLITHYLALPYVRDWVELADIPSGCTTAQILDEERFAHAQRIVCTVGGACGMAMLFDSPIGGIVYMFEEITAASWPLEVTIRAFTGTTVCALLSRALLNLCGTTTKAFVVYEWNPGSQPWTWEDVPFFILLAVFLGPFSVFHTRACLEISAIRQRFTARFRRGQRLIKVADAVLYAALCSLTCASIALMARCQALPDIAVERLWVRYDCKEGEYNPVASLLLTTSEGAVKRLFSRHNVNEIHLQNEVLAFFVYTMLNIGLTGVSVPSGNFTGSMLIGGLAGRIMGSFVRGHGPHGLAVSGVYAMVGSAAMLAGFKQMSLAVVIFITGCASDFDLILPLMVSVAVSLVLNTALSERGFDEEQILRKRIPFLSAEAPRSLDGCVASDLLDEIPDAALLPPEASVEAVKAALAVSELRDFPVVRESDGSTDLTCIGFTTRARLNAALDAFTAPTPARADGKVDGGSSPAGPEGDLEMSCLIAGQLARAASMDWGQTLVPVERLADKSPYTILYTMSAPHLYALFSKAGVRVASVISESGAYCGTISRRGLIQKVRLIETEESLRF